MKFNLYQERKGKLSSFSNILPSIIEEINLSELFIIEKIREIWSLIVGDIIAVHSIPNRIYKKKMFIYSDHSVFSNELSMMREVIIREVNNQFGFDVINNIRIEVKRLKWKKDNT